ncbi:MAG: hypothetical protein ACR65U_14405 [Methylocystis sp.]
MSGAAITPGWRNIVVGGREVWAYVGAGMVTAYSAPDGVPLRATIDGSDYAIKVTRMGVESFQADIVGVIRPDIALVQPAATKPKPKEDTDGQ